MTNVALRRSDSVTPPGPSPTSNGVDHGSADTAMIAALRAGDESAFAELVRHHQRPMLAVARRYVLDPATAEDVVQETWLAVIRGLDRFEGRSSLKTWIFAILSNRARTTGSRERRSFPVDWASGDDPSTPAVPGNRFRAPEDPWPRHWVTPPRSWTGESAVEASELRDVVREAINALPPSQQAVISLRDVEGRSTEEVGDLLGVTPGNQRVLLHRARSKVRAALDRYFEQGDGHGRS